MFYASVCLFRKGSFKSPVIDQSDMGFNREHYIIIYLLTQYKVWKSWNFGVSITYIDQVAVNKLL